MVVLDGEIVMHMDGNDHRIAAVGGVSPRGVPYAFLVGVGDGAAVVPAHTGLLPGVLLGRQ